MWQRNGGLKHDFGYRKMYTYYWLDLLSWFVIRVKHFLSTSPLNRTGGGRPRTWKSNVRGPMSEGIMNHNDMGLLIQIKGYFNSVFHFHWNWSASPRVWTASISCAVLDQMLGTLRAHAWSSLIQICLSPILVTSSQISKWRHLLFFLSSY